VIEFLPQWLERIGDVGVVDKPAGGWINFSAHCDFAFE
jgi:hypothetical protein